MNDPIKEFVERNRAAFDELEAPPFNLEGFKAGLNPLPEKKIKKLWVSSKWLVAASVLIALGTIFLVLDKNNTPTQDKIVKSTKPVKIEANAEPGEKKAANLIKPKARYIIVNKNLKPAVKRVLISNTQPDFYAKLNDSSSSSNRLSAILEIDKMGLISNSVLDRLAKTLNHDENSNVRLAALSVLEKYSYDMHTSALLVQSLNTQNDPMVQLSLVTILGKMKNLNINDKLYAIANDPNTFNAVKDEAYSILLKDDKL